MRRIVVAGGGVAGLRAAQSIRDAGFDGELTIVGDEQRRPYQRPPLSKDLLAGETEADDCVLRTDGLDAEWRLGAALTGLDPERRTVTVNGDEPLPYDGLVIATGRRPRPWPGQLPELAGFHTLRTLDDALALREALAAQPRVAIVGAGFIGCEVAATLRRFGLEVTVIELGPLPLPALGPEIGRRAIALHERHGVSLRLGAAVEGFAGQGRIEALMLADGERIDADLVLLALGSLPNSEWLQDSGIDLHRGAVMTDGHGGVGDDPRIVAAGDIAAWPHPHADTPICVEHWTNAGDMAQIAGANLLREPGARESFVSVPTFWSDQYDVKMKSAGLIAQADSTEVVEEDDGERWQLVLEARRNGTLVGAVTFNRNRSFIDYRKRIAETLTG